MSSGKTANLKLHNWAATDAVLRSEFNDNFNLIDSAVGTVNSTIGALGSSFGSCEIYTGEYVGTDEATHSLHFSKLPDIIFVQSFRGSTLYASMVMDGGYMPGAETSSQMSISGSSVTFTNRIPSRTSINQSGTTYYYIALCSVK